MKVLLKVVEQITVDDAVTCMQVRTHAGWPLVRQHDGVRAGVVHPYDRNHGVEGAFTLEVAMHGPLTF